MNVRYRKEALPFRRVSGGEAASNKTGRFVFLIFRGVSEGFCQAG